MAEIRKSVAETEIGNGERVIKAIEFKLVYLREESPQGPAQLVLGNGSGECTIINLRPMQLKRLALDAINKVMSGSITSGLKT